MWLLQYAFEAVLIVIVITRTEQNVDMILKALRGKRIYMAILL
jgi:hypothetical protein